MWEKLSSLLEEMWQILTGSAESDSHGFRLDHFERKRKKEAREPHRLAEFERKAFGLKAKLHHKKRAQVRPPYSIQPPFPPECTTEGGHCLVASLSPLTLRRVGLRAALVHDVATLSPWPLVATGRGFEV